MSKSRGKWGALVAALLAFALHDTAIAARGAALQVQIQQARGSDAGVDYASLARFGPWDDRNYRIKKADLAYLAANEADIREPIPAFFRVEMRKAFAARGIRFDIYPRSALNGFLQQYGGYEINGKRYRYIEHKGAGRYQVYTEEQFEELEADVTPNFLSGEQRITTPNGAAESAIAISPVDPNRVIAGTNGPGAGQKMWHSSNGGASWSGPVNLPSGSCCDPTVGWSTDGAIAYTADLSGCGGSGCAVRFFRSTNFGQSWTKTVDLATTGSDKEYLHVDNHPASPHKDKIYVAWHEANIQKFRRSTDNGLSFGSTITLDGNNRGIGSDITSDAAGNVYFFYPSNTLRQIRMVKSIDGGATFQTPRTVANTNASFDFPIPSMETRFAFIYNAADTDRSGGPFNNSVYVAWLDTNGAESSTAANNHSRIQVGRSRDGGNTWAVSTPHSTSDINTVDRFNHWLSVDNQGRVHVIYYDTRHSSGRTGVDLFYTFSSDGGVSWSIAQRISAVTSPNINDSFEWGDYNGMDLVLDNIISIYTDNRDETGGSAQSIDVYAAAGFTSGGSPAPSGPSFENTTDFAINDNATVESPITVSGVSGNAPATLQVGVNIVHTFIGDLKVDLIAPDGSVYVLHDRVGDGADNINTSFTVNASSEVANGSWKLRVNDNAAQDTGRIDRWSLQF